MAIIETNLGQNQFVFGCSIGDTITVDDDPTHCRVTAILIRDRGCQFEVSWMTDGNSKVAWVEGRRLRPLRDVVVGYRP
jgi:hypothetical protein